jgi:D-glycero-alpha-D-manno-heptose-7-phosphate kinase
VSAEDRVVTSEARPPRRRGTGVRSGLVVTRTPLRVSFAGGGTDLAAFSRSDLGAVFSTAIANYIYVTVKRHSPLFDEPIRLNYRESEEVGEIDEIRNDIARECLRFLEIEPPIYVSTVSDHPLSSGLGGSSSFAVGLLHALHTFRGERVSAGQLAEEACRVEIEVLDRPIGKQDQYAAAFGGLNFFCFKPDGGVTVEPQRLNQGMIDELFAGLMMFWTGHARDSSAVLAEQEENTERERAKLLQMREHAYRLQALMAAPTLDLREFGAILDESWRLKRELATTITTPQIDRWYDLALEAGAYGGKICGAGGGGCFLFAVDPKRHESVRRALPDLIEVEVEHEVHGSQVVVPFAENGGTGW